MSRRNSEGREGGLTREKLAANQCYWVPAFHFSVKIPSKNRQTQPSFNKLVHYPAVTVCCYTFLPRCDFAPVVPYVFRVNSCALSKLISIQFTHFFCLSCSVYFSQHYPTKESSSAIIENLRLLLIILS